jgi:hypothetical protein
MPNATSLNEDRGERDRLVSVTSLPPTDDFQPGGDLRKPL